MAKKVRKDLNECSICSCNIDEECGDIIGYFGISPVAFCVWCMSSMTDMVIQMNGFNDIDTLEERINELKDEEYHGYPSKNVKFVASDFFNSLPLRIQNALRSSSDFVKNWEEKDEDGKIYHPVGYEIINFSTASEYEAMKFLQKNINDNCSQLYRLRNCGMKSIQILKDFLKKRRN